MWLVSIREKGDCGVGTKKRDMAGELGVGDRRSHGCGAYCSEGWIITEQRRAGLGLKAQSCVQGSDSEPVRAIWYRGYVVAGIKNKYILDQEMGRARYSQAWPDAVEEPHQEEEIEDLLLEIARLKLRLSRLERRTNWSTLGRDFNGDRLQSKYATTKESRSLVPTKSLLTDNDEGVSDDQISSTPPSIEFSFEEIEDPFSKSPSLPFFDEPVYDVYEDDMFNGVLDLEQSAYDNYDKSKTNVQPELFVHNVPTSIEKVDAATPKTAKGTPIHHFLGISTLREYTVVHDSYLAKLDPSTPLAKVCISSCGISTWLGATLNIAKPKKRSIEIIFGLGTVGLGATCVRIAGASQIIGVDFNPNRFEGARKFGMNEFMNLKDDDKPIPYAYATIEKLKMGRQIDIAWTYPKRFSQPNPPP